MSIVASMVLGGLSGSNLVEFLRQMFSIWECLPSYKTDPVGRGWEDNAVETVAVCYALCMQTHGRSSWNAPFAPFLPSTLSRIHPVNITPRENATTRAKRQNTGGWLYQETFPAPPLLVIFCLQREGGSGIRWKKRPKWIAGKSRNRGWGRVWLARFVTTRSFGGALRYKWNYTDRLVSTSFRHQLDQSLPCFFVIDY